MDALTQKHLNRLQAAFSGARRITPELFAKVKATVAKLPVSEIERLADSQIRFVNTAANSLLCDRGIRPESARWDHAVEVVVDGLIENRKAVAS